MRIFRSIFFTLIVLSIPILLVTSSIRLALSPIFINIEYRMPGFPEDPFGFSTEDRLHWAHFSIDYLLGKITHEDLVHQSLPDGSPLFNERELIHMLDVRILTQIVLGIWRFMTIIFLFMLGLAWRFRLVPAWLSAVKRGSMLTIMLVAMILFYLVLDFNRLFTQFHMLFFEGDSWLFFPSDHLIRLFPLRFWQDLFIFIGGILVAFSAAFIAASGKLQKKALS